MQKNRITAFALAAITAALAVHSHAMEASEEASTPKLPATVVTADLWESELQQATASVSVIDSAAITRSASLHFEDVVNSLPNLTWTGGTSRPRYIQIRGIGENSQFEGETPDSSVRFLIDDLDLTGLGTVGNLFDVQQVEVLRGPQAGAFGANAAGGVVKIVTNEPTPFWTGQVEATVGNDSLRAGGLAIGGPLLEKYPEQLSFRLSLHQLIQNGFRKNQFLNRDDTNERDELTSRLKVRWSPSSDWQFDGTLFYADINNGYDAFTLNNARTNTFSDQPGRDEQTSFGTSLRSTWTGLDAIEVVSITSHTTTDSLYSFDGDWTNPTDPLWTYTDFLSLDRDRDVTSQEIRLNSKAQTGALGWIDRWTIGIYGQALNEDSHAVWESGALWDTDFDSKTLALFGQGTHDFTSSTRLKAQLRIEYYEVEVAASGDFYGTLFDYTLDHSETLWGGSITLEHDLSPTTQTHIAFGRGYKAGGASTPNFTGATDITYEAETLWTIESGLRKSFLDGSIDTNFTLFYIYREDPQFRDSQGAGSFFDYITTNGKSAEHFGLETETIWYIDPNWSFTASLGLLEAKRSAYTARGVSVDSRTIANAPTFTYSVRLDYAPKEGLFANIEVLGSDEYFESNSHSEKRSSYAIANAALGYRYQNWKFTIWAKNLFDEKYEDRIFFFNNGQGRQRYESPAKPRTFGLTANYSF